MYGLIAELKEDHKKLEIALDEVKKSGMSSNAAKDNILALKSLLLAHLSKEDSKLYPPLHKAAQTDAALNRKLEMLAADLEKVSQAAMDFFKKYEHGGGGIEFIRDFGALVGKLNIRIQWEETQLYPEYERRNPS